MRVRPDMKKKISVISAALFAVLTFAVLPAAAETAEHIVSLSPSATEILCAVGAFKQIAARTDFCDYPSEVRSLPSVGGFDGKTLSIEKIVSFHPDLVYATSGMHDYLIDVLKRYGIRVYISNASSIDDVLHEINDIGRITGHPDTAAAVQNHIQRVLTEIQSRIRNVKIPSVYWEIWNSPYMSAGNTSFMNGLLTAAGGKNIFADIDQAYPLVSEETIIVRNPDVVIIPDMEKETVSSVQNRPGWKAVSAVQKGHIICINADITARSGPRIAEAVLLLAKALHPDVSFEGIR